MQNERAILFTTTFVHEMSNGRLYGTIHDLENGEPLRGVVRTTFLQTAVSNDQGEWEIENALTGNPFEITATAQDFNSQTIQIEALEDEGEREINFDLTHPEFALSADEVYYPLHPDSNATYILQIDNTGNGPLEWSAQKQLLEEHNTPVWEIRDIFNVGEQFEDRRVNGIARANNYYYISRGNDHDPVISVFDNDYNLVEEISQAPWAGDDSRGFTALTFDGDYLWGTFSDMVLGLDLDGNVMRQIVTEINQANSVTWDDDLNVLWVASATQGIMAYNLEGEGIDSLEIDRRGLRLYGLAYYHRDSDGYNLYALTKIFGTDVREVYKFNTLTGDTLLVSSFDQNDDNTFEDAFVIENYDQYSDVVLLVVNRSDIDGGDAIVTRQLRKNMSWFDVNMLEGSLGAGDHEDIELTFYSDQLWRETEYEAEIHFSHNTGEGHTILPVTLDITTSLEGNDLHPDNFRIASIYPNPFNSQTNIHFILPNPTEVKLSLFDIQGRQIKSIDLGWLKSGSHNATISGKELSSGIYFICVQTTNKDKIGKVMLVR